MKNILKWSIGLVLIYLVLFTSAFKAQAQLDYKFLHAINMVETGGQQGKILGDDGRALGGYQIHKAYWQDAVSFDKTIKGKYSDLTNQAYSEKVMNAYMRRYAPKALASHDYQTLARIHNGGVSGATNPNTLKYWFKVNKYLEK